MRSGFRWQGALAGVALLVAPFACGDEGEFVAEPDEDDIGAVCTVHADCIYACVEGPGAAPGHCTRGCVQEPCPAGYYCVYRERMGQVCAMGYCSSDADCPTNYTCETDDYVCRHVDIPCGADADCPGATACNQGVCATLCSSDDDCKQGYVCTHDRGCLQCQHNSDCPNNFACVDGGCGPACAVSADCRLGYSCESGACVLFRGGGSGQVGDDCFNNDDSRCDYFCHHDNRCNQPCGGPDDPPDCPAGWQCHETSMICQEIPP